MLVRNPARVSFLFLFPSRAWSVEEDPNELLGRLEELALTPSVGGVESAVPVSFHEVEHVENDEEGGAPDAPAGPETQEENAEEFGGEEEKQYGRGLQPELHAEEGPEAEVAMDETAVVSNGEVGAGALEMDEARRFQGEGGGPNHLDCEFHYPSRFLPFIFHPFYGCKLFLDVSSFSLGIASCRVASWCGG